MFKGHDMDMTEGPLTKKIILYSLPLMVTGILQLLYNAADVIVVGRYAGSVALAAVGSTTSLINLILNVSVGLSVGASVTVAQDYGAKNYSELSKSVHSSVLLGILSGLLVAAVGFFASGQFLIWMDSPEDILPLSTLYLRIYFLGAPASLVYNFCASILRSVGDTRRPLIYLTISGILNVGLNLVFVILFHMSVDGVAYATIISQYVSAFMIVTHMLKTDGVYKLVPSKLRFDKAKLKKIVYIGFPAGLQGTVFSLSNVVIQSSVNSFGSLVVSASTAAANLEGFVYTAMNTMYQAALTFTGQNVGAHKFERIKKVNINCIILVCIIGIVLGGFVYIFAEPLLKIYIPNEPEALPYGVTRLLYVCAPYFLCGIMDVMVGSLRGMGASIMPMIVSLCGACGLRLIWIATVFKAHHTLPMLFISYPLSWLITASVHFVCYTRMQKKMVRQNSAVL